MDTRGQRQIAADMGLGMHLPVTSGLKQEVQLLLLCPNTYVETSSPFPLACRLQGYHGVIPDNLAGSGREMAQAGSRAGKTQPCMQMGEHGLD